VAAGDALDGLGGVGEGVGAVDDRREGAGLGNTRAIRKAISSDGEYRPCSMAMTVCRVTPMRSARSAWVISSLANRKARMEFVTRVGFTTAGRSSGPR
jgi:hypothetical protein